MSKRRTPEQIALDKEVKNRIYIDRVKKLRATNAFGDLFTAKKSGIDLRRSPDNWPAHAKARITRYARELGPLIADENITKRYYRKDHLSEAIRASGQEKKLPGQKAAIFYVDDPNETIELNFSKNHKLKTIKRGNIFEDLLSLDRDLMIRDPKQAVADALEKLPGNFFKFKHGKTKSAATYTRVQMLDRISFMVHKYAGTSKDIENFVTGIYAYPNITSREARKRDEIHSEAVEERRIERQRRLSAERRAFTKADLQSIRTTGRAGRVK